MPIPAAALSFPFAEYWWMYLGFAALMVVLLAADLVLHRNGRGTSMRAATVWTGVWIALGLAFAVCLYWFASARLTPMVGKRLTLEFLAGYVVEESLSVDNMFVFALIFRYFAVPAKYQHGVLFYGVVGAMLFRAIFIGGGAALIHFEWVMIAFGVFLIFTGLKMGFEKEKEIDPANSPIVRWTRKLFPVTKDVHGSHFFVRENGVLHITPLLIELLVLETTDIMFAVDSVPAVFGVTSEPFIVFSSNVFAILGLRSMFFLLSGALDKFYALKQGLAVVLVFVGLKMVWLDHLFGGRFPIGLSLGIIVSVIGGSIALSLMFPKNAPRAEWLGNCALQRTLGCICLLLAALSVAYATGWGHSVAPLPALDRVGDGPLYISAACYVVGAFMLLRKSAGKAA